ncbi:MAG TPA: hypothetical protein VE779_07665 [Candidatus Angelobacter sp.]|nr:hypothetical protein [Candidatus Angelobacter sp.]
MRLVLWCVFVALAASGYAQQSDPSATPVGSPEAAQPATEVRQEPAAPTAATPSPAAATSASLPDAPSQTVEQSGVDPKKAQPKRILGIMPNFRAVSPGATPPPPSFKQSLKIATLNSIDYSSFIFVGVTSAIAFGTNAHPALGSDPSSYWAYYWRGYVDKTDGNYWVICLLPTAFHQDQRYYAMGEGGFKKRTVYSATRIFVARKYNGKNTFNISEVLGRAIAQAISISYYPSSSTSGEKLAEKYAYALGRDALTNVFREFWPDIATHVLHRHP